MGIFRTIIIGLTMFLFLITIHELGHFIGAKLSGIRVNEFAIGMGPAIFKKQGKETLYSLRILPIGGYVMMEGEESDSSDNRSYNNAKAWKRFLTIFAGPFMNLLFAVLIIFAISASNGVVTTEISSMNEDFPAYKAGMMAGDRIEKINNQPVNFIHDITSAMNSFDGEAEFLVNRNGEKISFMIAPVNENGSRLIGINFTVSYSMFEALKYSVSFTFFVMKMILESLGMLITGKLGAEQLSGPVGVISQVGKAAENGFRSLLIFSAIISINLGLFNLLPIPALDGSKLIFNLYEMIFKKPFNRKVEEKITIIGFLALLALIIFISIKDVLNLFK